MLAVLGIDAAWTEHNASGVALVRANYERWECLAVSPSFADFILSADSTEPVVKTGSELDLVVKAAVALLHGERPNVVAVDMPMSHDPITSRRVADHQVSCAFGIAGCSTHSPNVTRPGAVGKRLTQSLVDGGYSLRTIAPSDGNTSVLIEVYPHPALLRLCHADYRLPYKVSRVRKYWPGISPPERRKNLLIQFQRIIDALSRTIDHISHLLPEPEQVKSTDGLKAFEDMLDALVCAWVGIRYLQGDTEPYGDDSAAIWIPKPT